MGLPLSSREKKRIGVSVLLPECGREIQKIGTNDGDTRYIEKEKGNVATVGWTQEPTLHGVILQSTGSTLSQTSATDAQDFHHADTRRES